MSATPTSAQGQFVSRVGADTADESIAPAQRQARLEFGLNFFRDYNTALALAAGKIPFPKRSTWDWLVELQEEIDRGM